MEIPFKHLQGAHCETATIASLLQHHGLHVTEPQVFGIGSGFFFAYLPFMKVTTHKFPLVSFRAPPGSIIKKNAKRLGVRFHDVSFKDPALAMDVLDRTLDTGVPVALQTGVFWLPYLPGAFRFHFNAHNIIVYGREGDEYRVSDPVLAEPVRCSRKDLQRARFSRGDMAPRGRMYYPTVVPKEVSLRKPVHAGLKEVAFNMLKIPIPLLGVKGMRRLAKVVQGWPAKLGDDMAAMNVGHLVLLLEEIGTGGAGFRFMYGSFLEDAARILETPALSDAARRLTEVGDRWREFALLASRTCKGRAEVTDPYGRLADMLRECADREEAIFRDVRVLVK
jgi:hypothetical protein